MDWTTQQKEAIEYRGKNILLAAAAGSGKTAVLVQRIIELIINDNVSVNELLVLTFTDAAAGEMREKIKKAIYKALNENPENQHLQKQRLLIHSANISTIHSFCLNLLKSNIHMTDLPVDFTLAGELENKIMITLAAAAIFAGPSAFAGEAAYEHCIYDSMSLDGAWEMALLLWLEFQ